MPTALLIFLLFVFLFLHQDKIDRNRFMKLDRKNNEHILREIEKFMNKKASYSNGGASAK